MQILMDLLNSVIPLQSNLQCELFLLLVVGSSYVTKSSNRSSVQTTNNV